MRGTIARQAMMLTAVTPDALVPPRHPIRQIKPMVDAALDKLWPTFNRMYAEDGRPSIPPEHLLKGCLLIALFSVRSERQFCERLEYDMLFKWFLDVNILDPFRPLRLFQEQGPAAPTRSGTGIFQRHR